ncbi:MAG: redoxin domain-containing protein [Planctomycetota bacterium]|jgi:peroxiredoxin
MNATRILAMAVLSALVIAGPALAQDGRPDRGNRRQRQMQPLTPEKAEAAWQWQAQEVARSLKLDEMQTKQLVKNYSASRKALDKAMKEAREAARRDREAAGTGDDTGDRQRRRRGGGFGGGPMRELTQKERDVLGGTLEMFLTKEQTTQAMKSMGSFSRQWDTMTDTVIGFKLDAEKTYAALAPIRTYMGTMTDARGSGDRDSMRQMMRDAREKMQSDLQKVLTEDQMAKLQPRRGRGGRGGDTGNRNRGRGGGPSAAADADSKAMAKVGQPAPDFTVADVSGTKHTLSSYKGRMVVLQWINPDCPICRRVSETGRVNAMMKDVREIAPDVVHITINSTHYMAPEDGAKYLARNKITAPVLVDTDGKIGHLYGAKTTPHMFVIDRDGVLRYQGAIDNDSRGNKGDAATNYVVQAVKQIAAGETVAPDSTRPYGCSVKYKK